jgi:hypothetical protein
VLQTDGVFSYFDSEEDFERQKLPKVTFNLKKLRMLKKFKLKIENPSPTRINIIFNRDIVELECDSEADAVEFVRLLENWSEGFGVGKNKTPESAVSKSWLDSAPLCVG